MGSSITPLFDHLLLMLKTESDDTSYAWLQGRIEILETSWSLQAFHLAFGLAGRKFPRRVPARDNHSDTVRSKRFGRVLPFSWTLDQMARTVLLIRGLEQQPGTQARFVKDILDTADAWEQIAVYSSMSLLPAPESYLPLAIHGLRTNIKPVFESIALHNPYPADFFPQDAWNQMYLKAAFIESDILGIMDIPRRSNESLSHIILDYVHERWAAGREVMPAFWYATTHYLTEGHLAALQKLAEHKEQYQRAVPAMICKDNPVPALLELPLSIPDSWDWHTISQSTN